MEENKDASGGEEVKGSEFDYTVKSWNEEEMLKLI